MKENYPKKIYYTVSEVAEILEESASLVRFWSNKFPSLIKPERNKKGDRHFTAKDVESFKLIYHLVKESGMTLEGAEKRLKDNASGEERKYKAIGKLLQIKKMLLQISDGLGEDIKSEDIELDSDEITE